MDRSKFPVWMQAFGFFFLPIMVIVDSVFYFKRQPVPSLLVLVGFLFVVAGLMW